MATTKKEAQIPENETKELTEDEIIKQRLAYNEELVEYECFYDGQRYKDDVVVTINGYTWQIQRGVKVMIPRKVAMVLEEQREQDRHTANLERKMQGDYEHDAEKYGIR